MSEKKSRLSGIFTVLIVIYLIVRIAMIASRDSPNSTHSIWDNSYLIWSVFVLVAVIGAYFWNTREK